MGHKISKKGIEIDKIKIKVIERLPLPNFARAMRSFFGHANFYRRLIKDFSKITKHLYGLLAKYVTFIFYDACLQAFNKIKKKSLYRHL